MIVILLCAGFGTRMYPLTQNTAKPLLDVAGQPVIDYLMDQLIELPQPEMIHIVSNDRFYADFQKWANRWYPILNGKGIQLQIHSDGASTNAERLGAVGDLLFVLNKMEMTEGALVAAGDNILRFSLATAWQEFITTGRNYIFVLPETDPEKLCRSGVAEIDNDNRLIQVHEKPAHPPTNWICPPFYFLGASALKKVTEFKARYPQQDEIGYFASYLVKREAVYAYKTKGKRLDIGSIDDYRIADDILKHESVLMSSFHGNKN